MFFGLCDGATVFVPLRPPGLRQLRSPRPGRSQRRFLPGSKNRLRRPPGGRATGAPPKATSHAGRGASPRPRLRASALRHPRNLGRGPAAQRRRRGRRGADGFERAASSLTGASPRSKQAPPPGMAPSAASPLCAAGRSHQPCRRPSGNLALEPRQRSHCCPARRRASHAGGGAHAFAAGCPPTKFNQTAFLSFLRRFSVVQNCSAFFFPWYKNGW